MPSIFKDERSPFWYLAYRDANGKRVKKSSKTTDRKLALRMAVELERAADAGRRGTLVETQMRTLVADLVEQATGTPAVFWSVRGWFEDYLKAKTATAAPSTASKYTAYVKHFLEFLSTRAALPLTALNGQDLRAYREHLTASGRSAVTVNNITGQILTAPLNAAKRAGIIPINPADSLGTLREDTTDRHTFTPAQITALLAKAENDWQGAILIGYYTGLRLGDVAALTWQAVSEDRGTLTITAAKTRTKLVLPLAPSVTEWLTLQPQGIGKAPLLPALANRKTEGKSGLSDKFRRLMIEAGITLPVSKEAKGEAGRRRFALSFHSLRHSFNSALANAGVAQELRQKLTGHASAKMNTHYTHLELETLRNAVAKIPGIRA